MVVSVDAQQMVLAPPPILSCSTILSKKRTRRKASTYLEWMERTGTTAKILETYISKKRWTDLSGER